MSTRVLVIPEDPVNNGYILKPLIEVILKDAGWPQGRVKMLESPRMRGYPNALKHLKGDQLVPRYRHFDLWVFVPDADRATPSAMSALEEELAGRGVRLICCPAEPELEVYCCVAFRAAIATPWNEVRSHKSFKETIFEPLLRKHGRGGSAGGGREPMIAESLKNRSALYACCPELARLRDRLRDALGKESDS